MYIVISSVLDHNCISKVVTSISKVEVVDAFCNEVRSTKEYLGEPDAFKTESRDPQQLNAYWNNGSFVVVHKHTIRI